jgi:hypothetical protein
MMDNEIGHDGYDQWTNCLNRHMLEMAKKFEMRRVLKG